jgi:hypothetical protein
MSPLARNPLCEHPTTVPGAFWVSPNCKEFVADVGRFPLNEARLLQYMYSEKGDLVYRKYRIQNGGQFGRMLRFLRFCLANWVQIKSAVRIPNSGEAVFTEWALIASVDLPGVIC